MTEKSERDTYIEFIVKMMGRCDMRKIRIIYEFVLHLIE